MNAIAGHFHAPNKKPRRGRRRGFAPKAACTAFARVAQAVLGHKPVTPAEKGTCEAHVVSLHAPMVSASRAGVQAVLPYACGAASHV
jgi:hypothetical protein